MKRLLLLVFLISQITLSGSTLSPIQNTVLNGAIEFNDTLLNRLIQQPLGSDYQIYLASHKKKLLETNTNSTVAGSYILNFDAAERSFWLNNHSAGKVYVDVDDVKSDGFFRLKTSDDIAVDLHINRDRLPTVNLSVEFIVKPVSDIERHEQGTKALVYTLDLLRNMSRTDDTEYRQYSQAIYNAYIGSKLSAVNGLDGVEYTNAAATDQPESFKNLISGIQGMSAIFSIYSKVPTSPTLPADGTVLLDAASDKLVEILGEEANISVFKVLPYMNFKTLYFDMVVNMVDYVKNGIDNADYYLASIANEYMNVKEVGQYINSNLASAPGNEVYVKTFRNINFLNSEDWSFGFYRFRDFDRKKGGFSSKWKDKSFDANEWNHLAVFLSQSYQQNYIANKFKATISFSLLTQDNRMIAENIIESEELVIPYAGDMNYLDKTRFDFYFYFTEDIVAGNCKLRMNVISEDHTVLKSQDIGIVVGEYTSNLLELENAYFEGKPDADIQLTFSDALKLSSVNETTVKLINSVNVPLDYSTTFDSETNTLSVHPLNALEGDFSVILSPYLEGTVLGYFDSDHDGLLGPELVLNYNISYVNTSFNVSTQENYQYKNIRFYNQSETVNTAVQSVLWDFGDGQTSSEENPYHSYTDAGQYSVTLNVLAENGTNYRLTKEDYVTINSYNEGHDLGLWLLSLDSEWLTPGQDLGFGFFVRNFGDYPESDYEIAYTLSDINGQLVAQDVITGEAVEPSTSTSKYNLTLDIDPLPEGFYSFQVKILGNPDCAMANNSELRNIYIGNGNPFETYEYINNGQLYYKDVKRSLEGSGYSISVDDHDVNHAWVEVFKDDGSFYERRYVAVGELEFFNAFQLCLVYKSEFGDIETAWCFGIPGDQVSFSPAKIVVEANKTGTYNVVSNEEDKTPFIVYYPDGGEDIDIVGSWYNYDYTKDLPYSNVYFDIRPPLTAERREYTFWVKMTADGEFLQKLAIEVIDPQPDFSVSLSDNNISTGQGMHSSIFINLDTLNGFDEAVTLNITGLPEGVEWHADPSLALSPATIKLTFTISEDFTAFGFYEANILLSSQTVRKEELIYVDISDVSKNHVTIDSVAYIDQDIIMDSLQICYTGKFSYAATATTSDWQYTLDGSSWVDIAPADIYLNEEAVEGEASILWKIPGGTPLVSQTARFRMKQKNGKDFLTYLGYNNYHGEGIFDANPDYCGIVMENDIIYLLDNDVAPVLVRKWNIRTNEYLGAHAVSQISVGDDVQFVKCYGRFFMHSRLYKRIYYYSSSFGYLGSRSISEDVDNIFEMNGKLYGFFFEGTTDYSEFKELNSSGAMTGNSIKVAKIYNQFGSFFDGKQVWIGDHDDFYRLRLDHSAWDHYDLPRNIIFGAVYNDTLYAPDGDTEVYKFSFYDPFSFFSNTITFNINNTHPPTVRNTVFTLTEDQLDTLLINYSDLFEDADTPPESIKITRIEQESGLMFMNDSIHARVGIRPVENHSGDATIHLQLFDGTNIFTDSIVAYVTPINDPPALKTIDSLIFNEDDTLILDLDTIVHDFDDSLQDLTFEISTNNDHVSHLLDDQNRFLSILAEKNHYSDTTEMQLVVSDTGGEEDSILFRIHIKPVNDPPDEFSRISPVNNGAVLIDSCIFRWESSRDPENDPIIYFLTIRTDYIDTAIQVADTFNIFDFNAQSFDTLQTVHWNVLAFDQKDMTYASGESGYFKLISDSTYLKHTSFYQKKSLPEILAYEDHGRIVLIDDLSESFISGNDEEVLYQLENLQNHTNTFIRNDSLILETLPDKNGTDTIILKAIRNNLVLVDTTTLTILPVNDTPFVHTQTFTVSQVAENNSVVGRIIAFDLEDDALHYQIDACDTDHVFEIVDSTGIILLRDKAAAQNLGSDLFTMTISVHESADIQISDTTIITIDLSNIDAEGTFTDPRDQQVYTWRNIGGQIWMTENLRANIYSDGEAIPNITNENDWAHAEAKAYCVMYNNQNYLNTYGALYSWLGAVNGSDSADYSATPIQGVCPDGWHLPTDAEWSILSDKDRLNMVFGGQRNQYGKFNEFNDAGCYWSASESDGDRAYERFLDRYTNNFYRGATDKDYGMSVRCIRNFSNKYTIDKKTLVFDDPLADTSAIVMIENLGDAALVIDSITGLNQPYTYKLSATVANAKDSICLYIWVDPKSYKGAFSDTLVLHTNYEEAAITVTSQLNCIDHTTISEIICEGESIQIGDSFFNQTGDYEVLMMNQYGCDSLISLNLMVTEKNTLNLSATLCEGENYPVGDSLYDETGIYTNTFKNRFGCDSVVHLDLTVHPAYDIELIETICEGESIRIGELTFRESGNYTIPLKSRHGCDSTILLDLTVNPTPVTEIEESVCFGESYTFGNQELTESGHYEFLLKDPDGCDSIVLLDLFVNPVNQVDLTASIFQGDSIHFGDDVIREEGLYTVSLTNQYGCDSIVTIDVEFLPALTWYVSHQGTNDIFHGSEETPFATIEYAISVSHPGDTIVVLPGTYTEQIDLQGKDIFITSLFYKTGSIFDILSTVLDGQNSHSVITCKNQEKNPVINGFMIRNGKGDFLKPAWRNSTGDHLGGGACIINNSNIHLSNSIIENCTADFGAGIYSENSAKVVLDNVLLRSISGQAVEAFGDSLIIRNSIIRENDAGIRAAKEYTEIYNSEISLNGSYTTGNGVALNCYISKAAVFDKVTVADNSGGSILFNDRTDITLTNSIFWNEGAAAENLYSTTYGEQSFTVSYSTFRDTTYQSLSPSVYYSANAVGTEKPVYEGVNFYKVAENSPTIDKGDPLQIESDGTAIDQGAGDLFFYCLYDHSLNYDSTFIDSVICQGDTIFIGQQTFSETGNYTISCTNIFGLDSIVVLELYTIPVDTIHLSEMICEGDTVKIDGFSFTETEAYTITLTNQEGCDSIIHLNLHVTPYPEVYLGPDTTISISESITLNAGDQFDMVRWSTGDTTDYLEIDSSLLTGSTEIFVVVSDNNCISSDTILITLVNDPDHIHPGQYTGQMKLYPNPTGGKIYIEVENSPARAMLYVLNPKGQIIYQQEFNTNNEKTTTQIDLTGQPAGMYVVVVKMADQIFSREFIMQ